MKPDVDRQPPLLSNEKNDETHNINVMSELAALEKYIMRNLKIRHLQVLVELGNGQSVSEVAGSMHVTQPAISKIIAEMEEGLGLPLFERSGRSIRPTAYGDCLIRHAREILLGIHSTCEDLRSLAGGMVGKVAVGMMSVVAPVLMPMAVGLLKQNWPSLNLILREGPLDQHLNELRVGKLDLVVGRLLKEFSADDLGEEVLFEDPVVIVAASDHPLAHRRKIDWHELNGLPWILPHEGAPMRQRLETVLATHGVVVPTNMVESISLLANLPLLQTYPVLGLFPKSLARGHEASGVLRILPLDLGQVLTPVGMIWSKNRPPTPVLLTVQDSLRNAALTIG